MPSVTVKGLPPDVHETLKAEAAAHGRSLNREIIHRLRVSVARDRTLDPEALLSRARSLQRRLKGASIDDAFLRVAKREGRP